MNTILYRGSISSNKRPNNYLNDSIEELRKWFDGEVIVSTWDDQKIYINPSLVDKIIISPDPGSGPVQSFKRQIVSFNQGIKYCSGETILSLRTDMCLSKDVFELFPIVKTESNKHRIFNNKIVVGNMMTIHPDCNEAEKNLRIGDWFHLGTKEDLSLICDIIDTIDSEDYSQFTGTEQAWICTLVKKILHPTKTVSEIYNMNELYWPILLNNFIVMNTKTTLGLINKNWVDQPEFHPLYLTERDYINKINEIIKI